MALDNLEDKKGEMLSVKEKFKEPPKEMTIWVVIDEKSHLNRWDGNTYNEIDLNSIYIPIIRNKRMKNELWVKKDSKMLIKNR